MIIERNLHLGGQLLPIKRINRWVLGFAGKTSAELAEAYASHIAQEAITVLYQTTLISVVNNTDGFQMDIREKSNTLSLNACGIVIATGVRVIGEELFNTIPGFKALSGTGLVSFYPLDHLDQLQKLTHKTIAVIGGGNNAYYTALDAAKAGAKVYLLIRSKPKARKIVQDDAESFIEQGLISIYSGIKIDAFEAREDKIEICCLDEIFKTHSFAVDKIFVRAGFTPNSDFLDNFDILAGLATENGYIKTDAAKRTSVSRVYAVGDVTNAKHQSVVEAIADGAIAAQDLSERI